MYVTCPILLFGRVQAHRLAPLRSGCAGVHSLHVTHQSVCIELCFFLLSPDCHLTCHIFTVRNSYADVCVHRLLAAAIGVAPLPVHLSSKSYLHDLAANMNRRHRSAQLAGRASVQLHTLIFFSGDGAKEEDAYVLDVDTAEASEPSFTVMVPRYGIEGRV